MKKKKKNLELGLGLKVVSSSNFLGNLSKGMGVLYLGLVFALEPNLKMVFKVFKGYEKPQFFLKLMGSCIKWFQTIYYDYIMV